jgi:hypothetical protein
MNVLAGALVLIFVLYLIDKHKLWRLMFKLTLGLGVLAVLGVGALFGWERYRAYRDEKRQEAEAAAEQVRFSACVSRLEKIPIPKDVVFNEIPSDIRSACIENADATGYQYNRIPAPPPPPPPPPKVVDWAVVNEQFGQIEKRCAFNASTTFIPACGFGEDAPIAYLKKGDRVQILSNKVRTSGGAEIYEVNFQQWLGWMDAAGLTTSSEEEKQEALQTKREALQKELDACIAQANNKYDIQNKGSTFVEGLKLYDNLTAERRQCRTQYDPAKVQAK